MDYTELTITPSKKGFLDVFEAELAEIGYESFLQEEGKLKAYIPTHDFDRTLTDRTLDAYVELIHERSFTEIPHTNWNAEWEASYEPVWIDDRIFIHAPFHVPQASAELNIILEPNMSFGTGHHPTTHMMLAAMRKLELDGKYVTDFGAGSGILAIYAAHKGAHGIGIEIDPNAADAARTNLKMNGVESFEILTGDLSALAGDGFDIILANINRNVIEESLETFHGKLSKDGWLLCAGFLNEDAIALKKTLEGVGMKIEDERSLDGWTMLATQKTL